MPTAIYFAAYFRLAMLSDVTPISEINYRRFVLRLYPTLAGRLFQPAATVESG